MRRALALAMQNIVNVEHAAASLLAVANGRKHLIIQARDEVGHELTRTGVKDPPLLRAFGLLILAAGRTGRSLERGYR
jgi:hypothetical protein